MNKVPAIHMSEHSESKQKKRGRPRGHRLSAATKLKISAARLEQERQKREARTKLLPAPDDPDLSDVQARKIADHFNMKCASCWEDGPKLRIVPLRGGHLVLCEFCHENGLYDEEVVFQTDPTP